MSKIIVSGASGLVGSGLLPLLGDGQYEVSRLVRKQSDIDGGDMWSRRDLVPWDPVTGELDAAMLEGTEAVVHLAGENIAVGRWNNARKKKIRESRVDGTRLLCEKLAEIPTPPKVLICASAIGYYGHRGDESLTEESPVGEGFLPDLCREWEEATEAAAKAGIRVIRLRIGIVLSPRGGALKKMLVPFKMGAGGKVGDGRQYMSWISLDDLAAVIVHCIKDESISGAVNAVAPEPVTNKVFTKTLGKVLRRPTMFPLPAFAAKIIFGEMAEAMLLCSSRVVPKALADSGFEFAHPGLESALRHQLGK
ncbi:MAG: TIGR01777 family oxidoreductase [Planctomycetota bacterium]